MQCWSAQHDVQQVLCKIAGRGISGHALPFGRCTLQAGCCCFPAAVVCTGGIAGNFITQGRRDGGRGTADGN